MNNHTGSKGFPAPALMDLVVATSLESLATRAIKTTEIRCRSNLVKARLNTVKTRTQSNFQQHFRACGAGVFGGGRRKN